ncbi:hypothetical protein PNOK_0150700 [Pyrrhoderma noxium]|uniref:DUF6534 domain-containing protein n=1 Tax=Pyrrhoderma noxium TaxID=2282107 RepID=A0A286UPQ5_9AGAM|nr:hypothetical protein PNOK_0150700 [Pyrrhoderma noxium]
MSVETDTTIIAGPLLLGYMLNLGLFGVLTVQTYIYFLAFKKTTQTLITMNDAFVTFAKNFGNPSVLTNVRSIWLTIPVFTSIISSLVQNYYAYRVYTLSRSKPLAVIISLISFLQFSSGITTGVKAHQIGNFLDLEARSSLIITLWSISTAVCDVLITLTKLDTGMDKTHEIITKLIYLIVGTGTLTAALAVIDVALFLSLPKQIYFICSSFAVPKLYSNSVLVLFNSRIRILDSKPDASAIRLTHRVNHLKGVSDGGDGSTVIHIREETWTDAVSTPVEITAVSKSKTRP